MTPDEEERRLVAQRRNARALAILLGAFVILMFAVSIAKIGMQHR